MKLFRVADLKVFALSLMTNDGVPLRAKNLLRQPSNAAVFKLLHNSKWVILLEQHVIRAM
jgi:hypothetical protein